MNWSGRGSWEARNAAHTGCGGEFSRPRAHCVCNRSRLRSAKALVVPTSRSPPLCCALFIARSHRRARPRFPWSFRPARSVSFRGRARRLARCEAARAGSAGPDELVLALIALNQRGVDRGGEGRVVQLQRDVFGSGLAGGLAPAGAELDAVGGDPVVGRLVVVALAGLDAGPDVEGERPDRSGIGAGLRRG